MNKDEKKNKLDEETKADKSTEATEQNKPDDEQKSEPPKDDKPVEEKSSGDKNANEQDSEKKGTSPETMETSDADALKAENLSLKTQLEAMKIGFTSDRMEDAVTLAEAIVKREGCDISTALQTVAKKYPDWKSDGQDKNKTGGFRIGADSNKQENAKSDIKPTAQKRWNRFN